MQPFNRSRRGLASSLAGVVAVALSVAHASCAHGLELLFVRTELVVDSNSPPGRPGFYADPVVFAARGAWYSELNVGTFGRGLEVGRLWRDRRGSYYTAFVRRRQGGAIDDTAAEVQTNQSLGRFVVQGLLRAQWPDRPEDDNLLFIPGVGAELYTSSYSFMAFRAIVDPRPDTGITFLLSNRIASKHAFVEGVIAPRTDGVFNYGVRGRWRWIYLGYARENDFDFSRIDRSVWILGYYHDLTPPR